MKIFVSYRSTDRASVTQLVSDLADMGHDVWYDQELGGGQLWWQNIVDNIRAADLLIFALTPRSLESYPCQLEYNYANALRRHILPVVLADGITYSLIPAVLQERQIVPYVKRDIDSYKTLSTAIRRLPAAPPLPDPLPDAPPVPISPLAAAREQVTKPTLSYEEQVGLLYQLKGYLGHEEYDSDARGVLERLSQHPTLYASVLREIEAALKMPPPAPQFDAPPPDPEPPVGERQDGDIIARAKWGGNRHEVGKITGRLYARTGNNKLTWVAPEDAAARPALWEVVPPEQPVVPDPFADFTPVPVAPAPPKREDATALPAAPPDPLADMAPDAAPPAHAPNQYDALELRPGERIIAEYKASFMGGTLATMAISAVAVTAFIGAAMIAGTAAARKARERRLTVTSQRLVFQPPMGSKDAPTEVELADIAKLDKAFKLGDPTIKLGTRHGEDLQFSLVAGGVGYGNREAFIKVVQQAIGELSGGGQISG